MRIVQSFNNLDHSILLDDDNNVVYEGKIVHINNICPSNIIPNTNTLKKYIIQKIKILKKKKSLIIDDNNFPLHINNSNYTLYNSNTQITIDQLEQIAKQNIDKFFYNELLKYIYTRPNENNSLI